MKHEKALSDLQRFGEMFSGLLALATEMRDLGSVEQASDEAVRRAKDATDKEARALDSLKAIQRDSAAYEAEHAARVQAIEDELKKTNAAAAEAKRQVHNTISTAMAEATKMAEETIADARKRATEILAKAESDAVAKARNADTALMAVKQQEGEARARLDEMNNDIAAAEGRLAEINAEIERMKARFA